MSMAGRPTYEPARGYEQSNMGGTKRVLPTKQVSAKDQRGQTKLKERQPGQNTKKELKERDFKKELEEKERKYFESKNSGLKIDNEEPKETKLLEAPDSEGNSDVEQPMERKQEAVSKNIDADDSDEESNSSDESENDDEDDTAELMKELERIKKEREEEAARKHLEQLQREKAEREQQMLSSNPLIRDNASNPDFNIKKRWYDDTVFKNQAKGEVKVAKRFINDTIRNDFHRKFLDKYVK